MSDEWLEAAYQETVDVEFTFMVESERLLDDVLVNLAAAGVVLEPWQRIVVSRWIDLFSENTPIPLTSRLAVLRGMLKEARCPAP